MATAKATLVCIALDERRAAPRARRVPRAGHGIRGLISTSVTYGNGNGSSRPADERAHAARAAARARPSVIAATNDVDATRSHEIVGREQLLVPELRRLRVPEERRRARAARATRRPRWAARGCRGAARAGPPPPRCSGSSRSRMFQTSASAPPGRKHAMDLRQRAVVVEPVERLRDRDERRPTPSCERNRLGRPVDRLGPARSIERAHLRRSARPRSTRAPLGASSRVSFPVPAPRSTTVSPCAEPVRATSQSTASCGYDGRARS